MCGYGGVGGRKNNSTHKTKPTHMGLIPGFAKVEQELAALKAKHDANAKASVAARQARGVTPSTSRSKYSVALLSCDVCLCFLLSPQLVVVWFGPCPENVQRTAYLEVELRLELV